jgi:glycosyltransferase involved in cell wall biosynthesis
VGLLIGYGRRKIRFVGDKPTTGNNLQFLEVDDAFRSIDSRTLMNQYEVRRGEIVLKEMKDFKKLRVAFVGVYKIACGISTYSEWLWEPMGKLVKEFRIFAEHTDREEQSDPNVVRCWNRGKPFHDLIEEIKQYDPDVVYIQHEWGIFPVGTHYLSLMNALHNYRVITTMHSVYHHLDKLVCEAAMREIIVHTNAAYKILKEVKKVSAKVHVIPHGCFHNSNPGRLWNRYQSNHLLIQLGFGFKYKGWENSLRIVNELRNEFPDIYFTGIFSETDGNKDFHDQYYEELMDMVNELGIQDHVALIRGFQSDEALDAFLRTNHVAIFPYIPNGDHTVYGCSGSARLAMCKGLAVVVSDVPLFDDLSGVCPRVSNVEEACDAIKDLFVEAKYKAQLKTQNEFLLQNSWDISARRYLEIL